MVYVYLVRVLGGSILCFTVCGRCCLLWILNFGFTGVVYGDSVGYVFGAVVLGVLVLLFAGWVLGVGSLANLWFGLMLPFDVVWLC